MLSIEYMGYESPHPHEVLGTVAVERLIRSEEVVINYFVKLISTRLPYHMLDKVEVENLWEDIRQQDQSIVDFLLTTHSTMRLYVPDQAQWESVVKLYALSYGARSFTKMSFDEQFLDGTVLADELENRLREEPWLMVVLSLYTFDLGEATRRHGEQKPKQAKASGSEITELPS